MNIFFKEFRLARNSLITWAIALLAVSLLFVMIYPAFSHDIEASRKLLANLPAQARAALGLSLDTFGSFLGFYAYILIYISLAAAVQGMNLGLMCLGREVTSGTTDFLLSRPVSRTKIFVSKVSAAIGVLIVTDVLLTSGVFAVVAGLKVATFNGMTFILLNASVLLLQVIFMSLGVIITQIFGRIRSTLSVSLGVCFGFFGLSLLAGFTGDKLLRWITPFQYFNHADIAKTGSFEVKYLALAASVIVISLFISWLIYTRHDARSAV